MRGHLIKHIITLLLLIGLVSIAGIVYSQDLFISGTVVDEKGSLIPGATVFLTNTKYMTAANSTGHFQLNDIPAGRYQLAVKMLGYTPDILNITLNDKPINVNVKLKENAKELKTVDIYAKDSNRDRYMALFRKNFIGESVNAASCKIINPDVIRFRYDKSTDVLTASADEMIVIENWGLGYRLNYLLTNFETDGQSQHFLFSGYPYFEELKGTDGQQKIWEDNRKIAYAGSQRHFFRAALNHEAELEGFTLFAKTDQANGKSTIRAFLTDSVFEDFNKTASVLRKRFNIRTETDTTALYIMYQGGVVPRNYRPSFYVRLPSKYNSSYDQLTKIQPIANDIMIDNYGRTYPSAAFLMTGFWAFQRVAELTPLDYIVAFPHKMTVTNYKKATALPDTTHDKEDRVRTQVLILQNQSGLDRKQLRP